MDTLRPSPNRLVKLHNVLNICLGKGGFDANFWVIRLLDVIDIAMIPMTYEPLEGVLVVAAGICPVDRYIWGNA
jgi:hypothetical protein